MSYLHFLFKSTEKKYNSCLRYLRNITWSPLSRQLGKYIYHGDRNTWPLATNQLIINSFSQGKRFRSAEAVKDRPHIRLAKARWDPFGGKIISNPMVVQVRLGGWLHRNGQCFSPGVGEEAKKTSFLKKKKKNLSSRTWITYPTAVTCDWSPKLTSSGAWKLRRKRHRARLHPPPLLSVSRRERPSTNKGGAATPQPGLSRPCPPQRPLLGRPNRSRHLPGPGFCTPRCPLPAGPAAGPACPERSRPPREETPGLAARGAGRTGRAGPAAGPLPAPGRRPSSPSGQCPARSRRTPHSWRGRARTETQRRLRALGVWGYGCPEEEADGGASTQARRGTRENGSGGRDYTQLWIGEPAVTSDGKRRTGRGG